MRLISLSVIPNGHLIVTDSSQSENHYYDTNVRLTGNGDGHWKNGVKQFRNRGNQIYKREKFPTFRKNLC